MLARKTLAAIDRSMRADGGAAFRQMQAVTLPLCADAYAGQEPEGRKHLGASVIGKSCPRAIFYSFRWASAGQGEIEPRLQRLFNSGHLFEGRAIAMLTTSGIRVSSIDPTTGKQYRIKDHGGHFGGSLDGIASNVPDAPGINLLAEFKTHGQDSFDKLIGNGVVSSHYTHHIQMNVYMKYRELSWALYFAVCKNTDEIHAELVEHNPAISSQYIERARGIIAAQTPPRRINDSAAWWECKICEHKNVCHFKKPVSVNCRTCANSRAVEGGWACALAPEGMLIPEAVQRTGCNSYRRAPWN